MIDEKDGLRSRIRRWTLLLGVLQVTFGCIVGFIPPSAVQWYRGIVMAHLEYVANGVLMIVLGFLVNELKLQRPALITWFVTLQVGTWTNGTAGLVGGFIGYSSALMSTLNEKFPAPHGLDHPVVSGLLQVCGVTIMMALALTLYGLLRSNVTVEHGGDGPANRADARKGTSLDQTGFDASPRLVNNIAIFQSARTFLDFPGVFPDMRRTSSG